MTISVGILSPGSMGSAVGRRLQAGGATVHTCVAGRSPRTKALAGEAGFVQSPDYAALVRAVDIVLSIVAPGGALALVGDVAQAVRHVGADVCYVDCNAVAPSTAMQMARMIEAAGASFVDGCIIGPPPREGASTKFYVSGPSSERTAVLRDAGLDVRRVDGRVGSASALKMAYAAVTKGTTALAVHMLVSARVNGVYPALVQELSDSQPQVHALLEGWLLGMPAKSARWVGELQEIERTVAEAGLPPGTFAGIAGLYEWVAGQTAAEGLPEPGTMEHLIAALAEGLVAADGPPTAS